MSRKSMRRAVQTFNPSAENTWSKDDSKFGQRMLEKMGWKKGQGIGSNGQGIAENVKIRCKFDNKGLGFKIKEDEWVGVELDFSAVLSKLSETRKKSIVSKSSLESSSLSSRSRVHYHKFIRGKDISKYSKEDLSGILGLKKSSEDEHNSDKTNDRRISEKRSVAETDINAVVSFEEVQNENSVESELPISDLLAKKKSKKAKTVLESYSDLVLPAEEVESKKSIALESAITDASSKRKTKKGLNVEFNLDKSAGKTEELSVVERNSNSLTRYENTDNKVIISMKEQVDDTYHKRETKKRKKILGLDSDPIVSLEESADDKRCLEPGQEVKDPPKKKSRTKRISFVVDLDPGPTIDIDESIENETSVRMDYENLFTKKKLSENKLSVANSGSDPIIYVDDDDEDESAITGKPEIENLPKKKCRKNKSSIELDCELIEIVDIDADNSDDQQREANDPPHETKCKKLKSYSSTNIDENIENEKSVLRDLDFSKPTAEKKRRKKKLCVGKSDSNPIISIDLDGENKDHAKLESDGEEPIILKNLKKRKSSNVELESEIENSPLKKKSKKKKTVTQEHSTSNIDRSSDASVSNHSTVETPTENEKSLSKVNNFRSDLSDFDNFMLKVKEFNSLTDVKAVLQEFEENKEKLLHKYRQNFIKKYLESANENDSRIYSDLNGDELDCQDATNDLDEVEENSNEQKCIKKARPYARKLPMSKAERIIYKARLLKSIQCKTFVHNFKGSNVSDIIGYGNEDTNS